MTDSSKDKKINFTTVQKIIEELIGKPDKIIVTPRLLIQALGDLKTAVFVAQVFYESKQGADWFWRPTRSKSPLARTWQTECGLSRHEVSRIIETVGDQAGGLGLIETTVRKPRLTGGALGKAPTTHYKIKPDSLTTFLIEYIEETGSTEKRTIEKAGNPNPVRPKNGQSKNDRKTDNLKGKDSLKTKSKMLASQAPKKPAPVSMFSELECSFCGTFFSHDAHNHDFEGVIFDSLKCLNEWKESAEGRKQITKKKRRHPAIKIFFKFQKKNVPNVWLDKVIEKVTNDQKMLDRWAAVCYTYISYGGHPGNVKGTIERFDNPSYNLISIPDELKGKKGKAPAAEMPEELTSIWELLNNEQKQYFLDNPSEVSLENANNFIKDEAHAHV